MPGKYKCFPGIFISLESQNEEFTSIHCFAFIKSDYDKTNIDLRFSLL